MMGIIVDGWVLPEPATKIYADGRQQKVALLIGNNSQEMQGARGARAGDIRQLISQRYGPLADRALALYGVNGASDPQPDPENGTVMLQFTTDNFVPLRHGSGTDLAHRRGESGLPVSVLAHGARAGSAGRTACL